MTPTSSFTLTFSVIDSPELIVVGVVPKETVGAIISTTGTVGVMDTVSAALPTLPAASIAVAVQILVVFVVTAGAVKVESEKLPPFVHSILGPVVTPTLSLVVKVETTVIPDSTVTLSGEKETDGASVSIGVIDTVSMAVLSLPAASPAVAVHTLVVSTDTAGAVKVDPEKLPPFVHSTLGPVVTPRLSVAVTVDVPDIPDSTSKFAGLKDIDGTVVSAAGGVGVGGADGVTLPEEPPPPHPERINTLMAAVM